MVAPAVADVGLTVTVALAAVDMVGIAKRERMLSATTSVAVKAIFIFLGPYMRDIRSRGS
jgi:hypothetical protein